MDFSPKNILFLLFLLLSGVTVFAQISYEPAFPNLRFEFPVEIQNANDGSDRMFVVEQSGRIRVFPNDRNVTASQLQTFLDIRSRVSFSTGQEVGLLGLAFHPNFRNNRYIFVYFTDRPGNYRINVARYQVSASNPNFVSPGSERLIASFTKNQSNSNHNGGKIAFGPDGYLYISVGDGGGAGDPQRNGQNLNNVFGSMLRIDVDMDGNNPVETNPAQPDGNYEIPSDNPRVGASGLDELYAWGIRNTWKFSFDPVTNRLWGGDVGQGDLEELNLVQRGGNYGWNRFEGTAIENGTTDLVTTPDIKPVYEYNHNSGDVSITAGYVYRGSITDPLLQGRLIYGDYVSGRVWSLNYNTTTGAANATLLFRTNGQFISSFGLDESGEIYFSDYGSSAQLYGLSSENTTPQPPEDGVGTWASPGNGTNGVVQTLERDRNDVYYIGGQFTNAGGIGTSNLAMYDGMGWGSIGGANGQVFAIATSDDGRVYAGGDFSQIGGVSANNVAFWDGSSWNSMGTGTNGQVQAIEIDANNRVYIGGSFENAGGIPANNIAFWENDTWGVLSNSDTGLQGTNNEIRSIAIDEDQQVYAGGNFDAAGGVNAARIAVWNGTNWRALGSGTSGFVQAIQITPNFIYAGGNFAIAGGQSVNRIARWNLNQNRWEALNLGLSGNVNSLAFDGEFIYAGGNFQSALDASGTDLTLNNAGRWSTVSGWQALGPGQDLGTNNQINSIVFDSGRTQLWTGGSFNNAGDASVANVAIWSEGPICTSASIIPQYRVNGVIDEGENQLTLNEGDQLILSMLSNAISYTIERPNGTVSEGSLDFGTVNPSDSGRYVFRTEQGCSETFDLEVVQATPQDSDSDGVNDDLDTCPDTPEGEAVDSAGCSDSQRDSDNDGINDDLDLCPNTPSGTEVDMEGCPIDADSDGVPDFNDVCPDTPQGSTVDEKGCPINTNTEQFTILSTGLSCRDSNDGFFDITSNVGGIFEITVSGIDLDYEVSRTFETNVQIEALLAGRYQICISEPGDQTSSCFTGVIAEPEALEVETTISALRTRLDLKLKGGESYTITLNDFSFTTTSSVVTLSLEAGRNDLEVKTDKSCQGIFETVIQSEQRASVFPNPFIRQFTLDIPGNAEQQYDLLVYSVAGQLVSRSTVTGGRTEMGLTAYPSGIYYLLISGDEFEQVIKLVKK